jgi:predicted anti-sigma-YlaC factor YlaD
MTCAQFNEHLDGYLDDTLAPATRRKCEAHLEQCRDCRNAIISLQALRAKTAGLPRAIAPARDLWPSVLTQLEEETDNSPARLSTFRQWWPRTALAAAACIAFAIVILQTLRPEAAGWSVSTLAGAPRVDDKAIAGSHTWRVGQWLETDATSRAQFEVGTIGEVELEPNSRLRLLETAPADHRIELARGTLHALIWAPPRLFFVETVSATAIDLGCAYTLNVDAGGIGMLEVTSGYVALEHGDRSAIVPAGMACLTRPQIGPGTPFATDASAEFRSALDQFDTGAEGDAALHALLTAARPDDAVTLWHLLARTTSEQRGVLFDKLSGFSPPPAGVGRAGIVDGDKAMLDRWALKLGLMPVSVDGSRE